MGYRTLTLVAGTSVLRSVKLKRAIRMALARVTIQPDGPLAVVKNDAPIVQLERIDVSLQPSLQVAIKMFDNVTLPNFAEMLPNWPGIPPIVRQPGFWVYAFLFVSCEYGVSLVVNAGQPWWLEKLLVSFAWGGLLALLPGLLAKVITRVWASQISALVLHIPAPSTSATVGQLCASCADSAPEGWLECNGQAVCRSEFSNLFSAIGSKFGSGNSTTTFNVPDLQGRVAIGRGSYGPTQYTLGGKGGEDMHTLQLGEMPAHSHGVHDPGHAHHVEARGRKFNFEGKNAIGVTHLGHHGEGSGEISGSTQHSHSNIHLDNTGNGEAHNNMPPYLVMSYFIKY